MYYIISSNGGLCVTLKVTSSIYPLQLLLTLQTEPAFKKFLGSLQERVSCKGMIMDDLLMAPLKRVIGGTLEWVWPSG